MRNILRRHHNVPAAGDVVVAEPTEAAPVDDRTRSADASEAPAALPEPVAPILNEGPRPAQGAPAADDRLYQRGESVRGSNAVEEFHQTLEDMAPAAADAAAVPPPRLNEETAATYIPASSQSAQSVLPEPGETIRRRIPHGPDAARIRIGRATTADLVLGSPQVALKHAVIERGSATEPWVIVNGGRVGRTFVNGVPIAQQLLGDGDVIRIGPYRLEVRDGEIEYFDEATGLLLQGLDLRQRVGRNKVILQNVSLIVQPHEFVAIVGASGSGKTTLLRALCGARRASGGQILLNDYPLYENFDALRTQIGFVPQDDIVHAELTVEQALDYAARLRLAADVSKVDRKARVEEVISDLGLEQQRTVTIANLSGGQHKRVSIGVELLTKPPLFFLDEPTSGLDPATGTHMMKLLRQLADQGRTVLVSTHVTRDIALCDKVLFLARGGRMAFFGSPREALDYFGVQDIVEIYDLLEGERSPEDWEHQFRTSDTFRSRITTPLVRQQAATLPDPTRRRVRRRREGRLPAIPEDWRQFAILTSRYARTMLKDRKQLAVLLLQAPIIALLLWALFAPDVFTPPQNVTVFAWHGGQLTPVGRDPATGNLVGDPGVDLVAVSGPDCAALAAAQSKSASDCHITSGNGNNQGSKAAQLAFLLAATAVWLGTLAAIREISKEHAVYARERLVNLRVVPYIASKFAVLFVFVVLQSALLLGVTAGYIHFPHEILAGAWLSLLLGGAASVAVALAVSAAVTNPERAIVFAPLVMVPQILLAGGLSPVGQLGVAKPLSAIVATRWTYEGIGRVFGVVKEAAIPEQFPYADALRGDVLGRWLILLGFIVGFGILAALLQRLKDRR